jgi:uncharacterized protein (TIGR00255 family)
MILSMTGFGRGSARVGSVEITVEARSVNNRFCEVSVRAPRLLASREGEIQNRVRDILDRGKINVNVQMQQSADHAGGLPLRVDAAAARMYAGLLEELRETAGISTPLKLDDVLRFSEVLAPVEDDDSLADPAWEAAQQALEEALRDLQSMRRQEGEALRRDLEHRAGIMEEELSAVERHAPLRVEEARRRLHERIGGLLTDERIDRARIETEIVLLADRLDVTEECVRLRSHLEIFHDALASEDNAGRRLNFLIQEFNREINTIASKASDSGIAHRGVKMKEELEKIREQVQNIV